MKVTPNAFIPLCISILLSSAGCAARQTGGHATRPQPAIRSDSARNVLTREQLQDAPGSNALEIIRELRPVFLRTRGVEHVLVVFVDNMRVGGSDELRWIPAANIREIRYLDSRAATQLFGTGYSGGIIHVLTGSAP